MKKKTIAEHMIDVLREMNRKMVWYGDLDAIEECAKRAGLNEKNLHPLHKINRVLNALERHEAFEKSYIKHLRRPARCFTLKENYRQ